MNDNMRVAISLVNLNGFEYLEPAINSLLSSDISQFHIKLFYWDNGSIDNSPAYIKALDVEKMVFSSQGNLGIVEPRINLMNAIIKEDKWDAVLEIHSDMLFPKNWFKALLTQFDERTGILMPYIIQRKDYIFDLELLENLVEKHQSNEIVYNSIAVHPWLLSVKCIREMGYYSSSYKNHRCEDDDFMLRILFSLYDIKAYKGSIVFHKGEVIRKKYLKRNKNQNIFRNQYGISVSSFSSLLLNNGDPRIVTDEDISPKKKSASKRIKNLFRKIYLQ